MLMILIYALASLWSLACAVALIAMLRAAWEDSLGFGIVATGVALPLALISGVIPWALIADDASPDLVTLKKGEWACSNYRAETAVMPVSTGKTIIIVPTTHSVCIQYSMIS